MSYEGDTLIDINELLGFLKKSEISRSFVIRGIESGNSLWKNEIRCSDVVIFEIMVSGMNRVHVNDLSSSTIAVAGTYVIWESY